MRWKFVKDNFVAAERMRINRDDYNIKCNELNLGEMKIKPRAEKNYFIRAAFNDIIKRGPFEYQGELFEFKVNRKVNDRFMFKMQIQSRRVINGSRWVSCLDVLYTKRKGITGNIYVPDTDKLAYKAHTGLGEALKAALEPQIWHRVSTTPLGELIDKATDLLVLMGDVKPKDHDHNYATKYGLQSRNIWHLLDEDEEIINRLNLLFMHYTDTTYFRKEQT